MKDADFWCYNMWCVQLPLWFKGLSARNNFVKYLGTLSRYMSVSGKKTRRSLLLV